MYEKKNHQPTIEGWPKLPLPSSFYAKSALIEDETSTNC